MFRRIDRKSVETIYKNHGTSKLGDKVCNLRSIVQN